MGKFTKKEAKAFDLMLDVQRYLNFEMNEEEKSKFKVWYDFFTDRLYPNNDPENWRGIVV